MVDMETIAATILVNMYSVNTDVHNNYKIITNQTHFIISLFDCDSTFGKTGFVNWAEYKLSNPYAPPTPATWALVSLLEEPKFKEMYTKKLQEAYTTGVLNPKRIIPATKKLIEHIKPYAIKDLSVWWASRDDPPSASQGWRHHVYTFLHDILVFGWTASVLGMKAKGIKAAEQMFEVETNYLLEVMKMRSGYDPVSNKICCTHADDGTTTLPLFIRLAILLLVYSFCFSSSLNQRYRKTVVPANNLNLPKLFGWILQDFAVNLFLSYDPYIIEERERSRTALYITFQMASWVLTTAWVILCIVRITTSNKSRDCHKNRELNRMADELPRTDPPQTTHYLSCFGVALKLLMLCIFIIFDSWFACVLMTIALIVDALLCCFPKTSRHVVKIN